MRLAATACGAAAALWLAASDARAQSIPDVRVASPVTALSGKWRDARVEVRFRAQDAAKPHGAHGDLVDHVMVVRRAHGGADEQVWLRRHTFGYLATHAQAQRGPALRATFKISVARDGHAIAVSSSSAPAWQYVALDGIMPPFVCEGAFSQAAVTPDPWPVAKDTRQLAIETFAAPRAADRSNPVCPVAAATLFASLYTDDEALWRALAVGSGRWSFEIFNNRADDERTLVIRSAQEAASRWPSVRRAFVAVLDGASAGAPGEAAALALAGQNDPDAERALVAAFERALEASPDGNGCWSMELPVWALAATAVKHRKLTRDAATIMRAVAGVAPCSGAPAGKAARAHAFDALAALGGKDRKLVEAAAKDCAAVRFAWPLRYALENEAAHSPALDGEPMACWARAALDVSRQR